MQFLYNQVEDMSGAGAVVKAVKPQMRGLLHEQIKKNLFFAFVVAGIAATCQKIFMNDSRKKAYAQFYK